MNKKKSYTSYSVNHIIDFSWITQVEYKLEYKSRFLKCIILKIKRMTE